MGLEAECRVWFDGKSAIGKAHLEPAELLFRGDFRLAVPLKQVAEVEARGGQLRVRWPEGEAIFELGKSAEQWALKIRYPKSRIDKLGVKDGLRVSVIGIDDEEFLRELAARTGTEARSRPAKNSDLIFYGFDSIQALEKIPAYAACLAPAGALWTVYPKGQKHLRESHVRSAGLAAGLVDTKVVAFSDRLTSIKWVIPLAKRK